MSAQLDPTFISLPYRDLGDVALARARELGATSMTLNVFGDNPTAIRLYETSGYTVTAQQMRREL